jgi:hypothetical protein
MKIARLLALGSFLLSCGGGGGASGIPEADACNQAAKAACQKVYACDAAIAAQALGTEAQCEAMILASCGTTGFQCAGTETYHGDKAQMCKDQFTALSCTTLTNAVLPVLLGGGSLTGAFTAVTQTVPPCGQICTGGIDAGRG